MVGFGRRTGMAANPITGYSLRFRFTDGPVAGKSYDHTFSRNGHVRFKEVGSDPGSGAGVAQHYEVASFNGDVHAVSYMSPSGHTLTTILDFKTLKLIAFASNAQSLTMQQGTFELLGAA
jgi:hypothetical protein